MAYRSENFLEGYDESRFEGEIRQDLICSICLKVLNDPKTCQNKEHAFCSGCIREHLRRSSSCPECREHLTPETLKNPPRFLLNTLSNLKISCEYNGRGCSEYVRLENLQNHIDQCGYAPVLCGNEGCWMEINERDKESHEKDLCEFRIAKCHDCRDIKANQNETKAMQDHMSAMQNQMKAVQDEMKQKLNETIVTIDGLKRKQGQIDNKVSMIKENIEEIKQTQAEMKQQYENITQMISTLLEGNHVINNRAISRDVIIIGGWFGTGSDKVSDTVEKFNVVQGRSAQLAAMNRPRVQSASCVYNNDVIVAGGYDGQADTDTIEILKMNQHPLAWTLCDVKLPVKVSGHAVVTYQDKLIIIGGYSSNETKTLNVINEVLLIPPYTSKLLARMPQGISHHCAEVLNNNLFILGGTTSGYLKDAIEKVFLYDVITSEFKPCASLPRAVSGMSTVTWGKMIIVVGGTDKNGQDLNEVIMYDTETGECKKLPSMIYKRSGCSAVIMNDTIVVMGGRNKEQGHLNSVETFTIGSFGWKELPAMLQKRNYATTVVKPYN